MAEKTDETKKPFKKYIWDEIKEEDVKIFEFQSGIKWEFLEVDGVVISKAWTDYFPDMRKNLPKIKEMNVRRDDVFICAYSKAGTHWLWEITAMLKKGKAVYENVPKESSMLEIHEPEEFDRMPSPRIFNTHLLFRQIPTQIGEKKCKVIFIQRNPKDIAVSFYNHLKMDKEEITWKDVVMTFGDSIAWFCWYDYTLDWERVLEDNHGIFTMYYEDLKRDPVGEIKKLANYLEVTCDNELAIEISNKCNFDNLKKANIEKPVHDMGDAEMTAGVYRKGQVGDWKNWFTVAQNERFDAEYKQRMKDSKFTFTYELP